MEKLLYKNLSVNDKGHLCFAGLDTIELAQEYGTPLMLLDEPGIREQCRLYVDAVNAHFAPGSSVAFASKALSTVATNQIMHQENMRIDVASIGELYTAYVAGYDMDKVYFHSNTKSDDEIKYALAHKIGYFMVDNFEELECLNEIAGRNRIKQKIFLRITPGVKVDTLAQITTGTSDSKFGVAIPTGQAEQFVKKALEMRNIEVCGYHCHIGSQIFDAKPYLKTAEIMLRFSADMKKKTGYEAPELILGGGFGVRYVESQPNMEYVDTIEKMAFHIVKIASELNLEIPRIGLEPGRSIMAQNGMTIYTVGSVKEIPGVINHVIVDGGMADNPRFALYRSPYTVLLANRMNEYANFKANIVGKACESGDIIQEGVIIPKPVRGDRLTVLCTGAYNFAMASNYNRIGRPPVIGISGSGFTYPIIKRETLDDLIKNDNGIPFLTRNDVRDIQ